MSQPIKGFVCSLQVQTKKTLSFFPRMKVKKLRETNNPARLTQWRENILKPECIYDLNNSTIAITQLVTDLLSEENTMDPYEKVGIYRDHLLNDSHKYGFENHRLKTGMDTLFQELSHIEALKDPTTFTPADIQTIIQVNLDDGDTPQALLQHIPPHLVSLIQKIHQGARDQEIAEHMYILGLRADEQPDPKIYANIVDGVRNNKSKWFLDAAHTIGKEVRNIHKSNTLKFSEKIDQERVSRNKKPLKLERKITLFPQLLNELENTIEEVEGKDWLSINAGFINNKKALDPDAIKAFILKEPKSQKSQMLIDICIQSELYHCLPDIITILYPEHKTDIMKSVEIPKYALGALPNASINLLPELGLNLDSPCPIGLPLSGPKEFRQTWSRPHPELRGKQPVLHSAFKNMTDMYRNETTMRDIMMRNNVWTYQISPNDKEATTKWINENIKSGKAFKWLHPQQVNIPKVWENPELFKNLAKYGRIHVHTFESLPLKSQEKVITALQQIKKPDHMICRVGKPGNQTFLTIENTLPKWEKMVSIRRNVQNALDLIPTEPKFNQ
jgi:hypothetical protein